MNNNSSSLTKKIIAGAVVAIFVAGWIGIHQISEIISTQKSEDEAYEYEYENINYDELSTMTFDIKNTECLDDEGLFLTIFNSDGELEMYLDADNQGYVSDDDCYLIPGEHDYIGISYNGDFVQYEIKKAKYDTEYQLSFDCETGELNVTPVSTKSRTVQL